MYNGSASSGVSAPSRQTTTLEVAAMSSISVRTCSVEGCSTKRRAKGLCSTHYKQALKTGEVAPTVYPSVCSVDGCKGKPQGRGFCPKHYQRNRINGTPHLAPRPTPEERFWSYVNIGSVEDCWEWQGALCSHGYGNFLVAGKTWRASRYSFYLAHPKARQDLFVCHKCDNPKCVNPSHLFLGTHTENMQDMIAKGRRVLKCGESNSRSKLTTEEVLEIRARYKRREVSYAKLAIFYGVSVSLIGDIVNRKTWTHV